MAIFQVLFTGAIFGIVGFILYWISVVLHTGLEVTKDAVDRDPRI